MSDKIALITGAGRGIGRAIALRCAREGAHVVVADIEATAAHDTAMAVEALGRRGVSLRVDLGEVTDIHHLVVQTLDTFGRIDILVNNAGVAKGLELFAITPEDWDWMHRINARGTFFCLQAVARQMVKQQYGKIVNIASIAAKGYRHTANLAYAASKGAVISMTLVAAQQLAGDNINVNAICPGPTQTDMLRGIEGDRAVHRGIHRQELEQRRSATIPLKRINTPDDIAALAVFLASDEARNITGQTINVDGGVMSH